jgi:hypothetical protein
LIIPVARVWQRPGAPVIDVEDMDALVRIAEHYDRSILHEAGDEGEAFWVTDESGQFRYALGAPPAMVGGEIANDRHADRFLGDAYVDALEFGGTISAYETQPAAESLATDPTGWNDSAAHHAPDTTEQEGQAAHATREAAAAVYADELKLAASLHGIG